MSILFCLALPACSAVVNIRSEVPDTFALLPRLYSDQFFSLNSLVAEGAMCLGGPNFDKESLSAMGIVRHNLSAEEEAFAKEHLCKTTEEGFSEQILKRKLHHDGIALGKNNLGYQTFFFALVRPNMDDMCFYLEDR